MITSKGYLALGVLACASLLPAAVFVPPDRDPQWQTSLNDEWTFKLNGPAAEFVQPEFDDSAWAKIHVPAIGRCRGSGGCDGVRSADCIFESSSSRRARLALVSHIAISGPTPSAGLHTLRDDRISTPTNTCL